MNTSCSELHLDQDLFSYLSVITGLARQSRKEKKQNKELDTLVF